MTEEVVVETVRQWFEEIVQEAAEGNLTEFARMTGIKQSDISNVINTKVRRKVTWKMIARMSETPELPSIGVLMGRLAKKLADVPVQAAIAGTELKLQRERLRSRLASGEVQGRARARRGRRPTTPRTPQQQPEAEPSKKKDEPG